MRALTVDEYATLQLGDDDEHEFHVRDALLDAGLYRYSHTADGYEVYRPTAEGDRAVRVHRAWLQSMGVQ